MQVCNSRFRVSRKLMQVSALVTLRESVINLSSAMERLMNIAYIVNNHAE